MILNLEYKAVLDRSNLPILSRGRHLGLLIFEQLVYPDLRGLSGQLVLEFEACVHQTDYLQQSQCSSSG